MFCRTSLELSIYIMSAGFSREESGMRPQVWLFHRGLAKRKIAAASNPQSANSRRGIPRSTPLSTLGAGIKVKVNFFPKLGQLALAIATLLFIGSVDLLVFTVLTVTPGQISSSFQKTSCRVSQALYNGRTYCYVTSLSNHGKIMAFPCLQVYIKVLDENYTNGDVVNLVPNPINKNGTVTSALKNLPLNYTSEYSFNSGSKAILMFENELHLAGQDYIHRPCSYLPYYCNGNLTDIDKKIKEHADELEKKKNNFTCYYNKKTQDLIGMEDQPCAIHYKTISRDKVIHAIAWPIVGMVTSLLICSQFWMHNKDHVSRLFVYNSWSLS